MERVTVDFFEGSQYWEVKFDGDQIFTSSDRYEAFMFAAELKGKLNKCL